MEEAGWSNNTDLQSSSNDTYDSSAERLATRLIEKQTTISSEPDTTEHLERNRIRVTTTVEQEAEHIGMGNLIGRYLRLRRHRQSRRTCR
jgi:hypothetical protein